MTPEATSAREAVWNGYWALVQLEHIYPDEPLLRVVRDSLRQLSLPFPEDRALGEQLGADAVPPESPR